MSQEVVASRISELTGEEVGQAAVSYWELRKVDFKKVHPRRLRAYAEVLGITTAKLAETVGLPEEELFFEALPTPAPHPASAAAQGYNIPNTVPEIPETLLEAARLYGDTSAFAGLRDLRWQRFLADLPYKNGPRTPEAWLEAFVEAQGKYDPR